MFLYLCVNVLGLAKRVKAKILQASTSEVYDDPAMHPQVENYGAMSIRRGGRLHAALSAPTTHE